MAIKYNPQPMPQIRKIDFSVNAWQGLNRIKGSETSGEMVSMKNMSSDSIPFASPRKSREVVASGITNPQNIFSANDKLGYIADGQLFYDKGNGLESIGTVGNTSSITDFNGNVVMYPSNFYYDYVNNAFREITLTNLAATSGSYLGTTGAVSTNATADFANEYYKQRNIATIRLTDGVTVDIPVQSGESITINSNATITPTYQNVEHYVRLYIVAFNSNGGVISYDSENNFYSIHELGSSISIPNAVKIRVMLGYSRKEPFDNNIYSDATIRSADLARTDFKVWITHSSYPTEGVPTIKYACADNNRIIGVEKNNFYASSQGSFSDWTTFADAEGNPDPTGSYATELGTPQDITGVVKYNGKVIIAKPDSLYEVYGNKPPYTIIEGAKTGCIDGRSICEVNSVLYWLGRQGVYAYTGGQPRIISEKLNITFSEGIAGTDGRKYYLSAFDGTKWVLYVYDTYTGLWYMEDNLQAVGFAYAQGYLHALTSDGTVYKFSSGTERVQWEFETQDYTFDTETTKSVPKLYIRAEMTPYSELDIYLRANNNEYERVASYSERNMTMIEFKTRVRKCDSFSIKFKGRGNVRILDIHAKVTIGTSKRRSNNLRVYRG